MAPKSGHVAVLAFLCVAAVAVAVAVASDSVVGVYKNIEKPNDNKMVVKVAKFAVEKYNNSMNESLVLVSVVKAETLVVAGINYKLVIACNDGNYRALVHAGLDGSRHLSYFLREDVVV